MDRALVAISILLAAPAFAAAEPPASAPAGAEATASAPLPVEPVAPVTTPAAAPSEPAIAPASADAATATVTSDAAEAAPITDAVLTTDAAAHTVDAAPTANATEMPTVDMKKLTDDTVCRKERPTGSLIGVMRCYSRSATTDNADALMRRDVEEMRMRQNDQQAREAAAAMSRRRPVQ